MHRNLDCHLVFSTKYRQPFINNEIESELYSYIASILREECHSPALIIGGDKDHIHILFALSRVWTVAKVVELIKKRSSRWIKTKGEKFHSFQWQTGYGAFSVSHSNLNAVKNYIAVQKEYHRKHSFQDEFQTWLRKYEIDYDEKYVWD